MFNPRCFPVCGKRKGKLQTEFPGSLMLPEPCGRRVLVHSLKSLTPSASHHDSRVALRSSVLQITIPHKISFGKTKLCYWSLKTTALSCRNCSFFTFYIYVHQVLLH